MSVLKEKINPERLSDFFNQTYWFHTLELGEGKVTKGVYDVRPIFDMHGFKASLTGKSVLDVGASDGFYSFEFEKLGAASVLALDNNPYDGTVMTDVSPAMLQKYKKKYSREKKEFEQFQDIYSSLGLNGANKLVAVADYLDSIVQFKNHSIYELDKLGEKFDLVFCGGLVGHLKNPLEALEQLRIVTGEQCIITLNGALPHSESLSVKVRKKIGRIFLRSLRIYPHFSDNENDLVLKYIGNIAGGSFFHIHPVTFQEMLLASGFKKAEFFGEYRVVDHRIAIPQRGAVFHCFV